MTPSTIPIFQRADQLIDAAVTVMELLRGFPDHMQADVWREELQRVRDRAPAVYAGARMVVLEKYAAEDRLRSCPEICPRCQGAGSFIIAPGRMGQCGCPLGEAAARGRSLGQDAIDRGIDDRHPDPFEGKQDALF